MPTHLPLIFETVVLYLRTKLQSNKDQMYYVPAVPRISAEGYWLKTSP